MTNMIRLIMWHKSSWAGPETDSFAEVAFVDDEVWVRNSKSPDDVLKFNREEWEDFVDGAKEGDFNLR